MPVNGTRESGCFFNCLWLYGIGKKAKRFSSKKVFWLLTHAKNMFQERL